MFPIGALLAPRETQLGKELLGIRKVSGKELVSIRKGFPERFPERFPKGFPGKIIHCLLLLLFLEFAPLMPMNKRCAVFLM